MTEVNVAMVNCSAYSSKSNEIRLKSGAFRVILPGIVDYLPLISHFFCQTAHFTLTPRVIPANFEM